MTDQFPHGHSFRAQLGSLNEPRKTPVVESKRALRDESAEGLAAVGVQRSEGRRGDHRGGDRHRLSEERSAVRHKGREIEVELINLSCGGAMVQGTMKPKLWDIVELQLGPEASIECAVRWIRGDRFGLEFAHETRIDCDWEERKELLRTVLDRSFPDLHVSLDEPDWKEASADQSETQARTDPRHPLIWTAIVHHDYEWDNARLRNISTSGALIECPLSLPEGATVHLEIGNSERFAAEVRWRRGDHAGLAFEKPFDLAWLASIRPAVAPETWAAPDYLQDKKGECSPWADRWQRLSLKDLSRTLSG